MAPRIAMQNAARMPPSLDGGPGGERERRFRLDTLLHGAGDAVHGRIVALKVNKRPEASGGMGATAADAQAAATPSAQAFSDRQIYSMSNAWVTACVSGLARISGEASNTRTCAVTLQHYVENWLTERLNVQASGPAPFAVVAAIHTPAPASPLRQLPEAPVSATLPLLAPHLRGDANVQATVACRAGSVRRLLDAGAILHVCYSADSLKTMSTAERDAYQSTCAAYPGNLIDVPSALPPAAFYASCGATYLFGASRQSLTGCFAIRLPQAADAAQGQASAELAVVSSMDSMFGTLLDEVKLKFGLQLDRSGGVATRSV
jgi:hypothetical protein